MNCHINASVSLFPEQALKRAPLAYQERVHGESWGLLHVIQFTVTDAFDAAAVLSTGGSIGRKDAIPTGNVTIIERLLIAEGILLGKTNTPEVTLFCDTSNLLFGPACNPYERTRSPGGNSGSSIVIVAAGGYSFDLGSDTDRSIRLPSHSCSIAGITPTTGFISHTGLSLPEGALADPLTLIAASSSSC